MEVYKRKRMKIIFGVSLPAKSRADCVLKKAKEVVEDVVNGVDEAVNTIGQAAQADTVFSPFFKTFF